MQSLCQKLATNTLLNFDYKIVAKAIANWLQNVLSKQINSDQTSFLKGRFIGENIGSSMA